MALKFDRNQGQKSLSAKTTLCGQVPLRAQGTIEYLVIVAIIVVISLIVVGLMIDISNQGTQVNDNSKNISNKLGVEGISVIEAISDYEGDGVVRLNNIGGETVRLTKISTETSDNNYDNILILGEKSIDISGLCTCEQGTKNKTCNFKFHFTTNDGLEKVINQTITVTCNDNFEPKEPPITPLRLDCFNITSNPIEICSLSDLNRIREKLDGNYILTKNIDASETRNWRDGNGWDSIGVYHPSDSSYYFTGTFDGQRYAISNLYINESDHSRTGIGLFSFTKGDFNNIVLLDVNISSAYVELSGRDDYVGSITGYLATGGSISNSYATGYLIGDYQVGGLAGQMAYSSISNSYFDGNVTGYSNVGGISGYSYGSNAMFITNSYSTGWVNGGSIVGGVVGYISSGTISNSYSRSSITASSNVGGFVGQMAGGTIINSYAAGPVSGVFATRGGFAGSKSSGTITNCGWWNLSGPTNAIGSPAGPITYSESSVSAFYNSTHNVYDSVVPYWTFGEDKNWIASGSTYPILAWQND